MNLPLHLHRRSQAAPASAWLSEGSDPRSALLVCALLGLDPSNRLFAVGNAILVRFDEPTHAPLPLGTRLRALDSTANLLLPADADLAPALLDDEAAILGRHKGFLFLLGGRVLPFDPSSPIPLSSLVSATRKPSRAWTPLPRPTPLAVSIHEWILDLPADSFPHDASDYPPEAADDLLEPGGEGIADEPTPLESPDSPRNLRDRARNLAGRSMMGLGRAFGLGGLQSLGRSWLGAPPLESLPAPGASLEGRQADALRALLREFREGNLERALRHALPFREPSSTRPHSPETSHKLPDQTTTYTLSALFGPSDRGPATIWTGGQDVLADLVQEYRRAAQNARDHGDFRRSAFIYGRLLRDYSAAAQALLAGGLYRDAAILYLAKLDNPLAAARAFEAACEFERALTLYRRENDHESAANLLRKMGRTSEALSEYRLAAESLIASHKASPGTGHLAAGNLMSGKAGRPDLALEYYLAGWRARDRSGSLSCALASASLLADSARPDDLLALSDEADAWFASSPGGPDRTAQWYNHLSSVSRLTGLEPVRDTLLDRARIGLARLMVREIQPGFRPSRVIATLFTPKGLWSASMLRDAEYAARDQAQKTASSHHSNPRSASSLDVETGAGPVFAIASASAADLLFLGFQTGQVLRVHIPSMEISTLAQSGLPVASIATDPEGATLAVLRLGRGGQGQISTFLRSPGGRHRIVHESPVDGLHRPWLTPADSLGRFGIWDGVAVHVHSLARADHSEVFDPPPGEDRPTTGLLLTLPLPDPSIGRTLLFFNQGFDWSLMGHQSEPIPARLSWRPSEHGTGPLRNPVLSTSWSSPQDLELATITEHGAVGWASFHFNPEPQIVASSSRACRSVDVYRAACLVRPGLVAAVSRLSVDILRRSIHGLVLDRSLPSDLSDVVAVSADSTASNLCLVTADGLLRRLPIPT